MEDIRQLDLKIKNLYDVADVMTGFDFWFWKIVNLLLQMFKWEGLLVDDEGRLYAPPTSIYGQDRYYQPTNAVFASPTVSGQNEYTIGKDCVCIYNSSLKDSMWYIRSDNGLLSFIKRYARMLADIESTINIYTVNQRLTAVPVTEDQNVAQSIKAFFRKLIQGKREIITDNNLIESFRNVDIISKTTLKDGVNDWLIARDKVFEQMYRDLGVRMYQPKKAQVTESELESNDQVLLIALDDLDKARKTGAEELNQMFGARFGFEASVSLNDKFDIMQVTNNQVNYKEDVTNENNDGRII